MEMQEQSLLNEMMYDEIHEIDNEQQDYRSPTTRSRAKTLEPIETLMGENPDQIEDSYSRRTSHSGTCQKV